MTNVCNLSFHQHNEHSKYVSVWKVLNGISGLVGTMIIIFEPFMKNLFYIFLILHYIKIHVETVYSKMAFKLQFIAFSSWLYTI